MQTSYQEDEIEIDLQDLFGLLLHKAWIIILAAIVAGAIGFAVSFFLITPQYESTTSIRQAAIQPASISSICRACA